MTTVQNANFIQYGRRKGVPKSAPEAGSSEASQIPQGMMLRDGTDLRQIKVLPRHEWDRIQDSIHAKQREMELMRERRLERLGLHEKSQDAVKNWTNTIIGQRTMKLQAKQKREEKEEAERVKLDIEEAKFQAELRKKAIAKAMTQQYYQTDRVKSFHGALLLSEVLKERDAQVQLKREKAIDEAGKDHEQLEYYKQQYQESLAEEHAKAAKRYHDRKLTSDFQKIQAAEHVDQRAKEKKEDEEDGAEIQRLTKLYEWEQEELEKVRKAERMEIKQSHVAHLQNKQAIAAVARQQEEEEDDEIRLFAAAKKKMQKLRKEKEAELFKEVQDHKSRMTALLEAQLQKKTDNEDERIRKAVQEREDKLKKEIGEKQAAVETALASIAEHRHLTEAENERKAREHKQEELEALRMRVAADQEFAAKQEERRLAMRAKMQKMQHFRVAQINERAQHERQNRDDELHNDAQIIETNRIEEQQFQQYAGQVIAQAANEGRNTYPLKKAALAGAGGGRGPVFEGKGGIRPSYLTADGYGVQLHNKQRSTTDSVKSKTGPGVAGVAKKRLGFTW